jgi:hypothetical protein
METGQAARNQSRPLPFVFKTAIVSPEISRARQRMMRKAGLLAVFLICLGGGAALADPIGPDWMPIDQVAKKLQSAGYSLISEISADDGQWEGEGVRDGKRMKFYADAKTGEIIRERPKRRGRAKPSSGG